jgi:hypothetical protein
MPSCSRCYTVQDQKTLWQRTPAVAAVVLGLRDY